MAINHIFSQSGIHVKKLTTNFSIDTFLGEIRDQKICRITEHELETFLREYQKSLHYLVSEVSEKIFIIAPLDNGSIALLAQNKNTQEFYIANSSGYDTFYFARFTHQYVNSCLYEIYFPYKLPPS